ncbi:MAG: hypothetical protein IPG53_23515 [Ignavibacteriales bacterium]|nr:hypothetical protein [Ignavibacteriales bacterium]
MSNLLIAQTAWEINTGRIKVPFDNRGVISDVTVNNSSGLKFDGISTIYSNGFALSGFNGSNPGERGDVRSKNVGFPTGKAGSAPDDPKTDFCRLTLTIPIWELAELA